MWTVPYVRKGRPPSASTEATRTLRGSARVPEKHPKPRVDATASEPVPGKKTRAVEGGPSAHGLVPTKESIHLAALALEGSSPLTTARPDRRVPLERSAGDQRAFKGLMTGKMTGYSVEEIRRFLIRGDIGSGGAPAPHITRAYLHKVITPHLKRERPIDRFGEEPRYLIAAHLAHHLLGAPVGRTEEEAMASFIDSNPGIGSVWPGLDVGELPTLRRIYPFIPEWRAGKKASDDLSLERPYDNAVAIDLREKIDHVFGALDELKKIPLWSPLLDKVNSLRGEEGMLKGARYVDVTHAFADKIPLLQSMIGHDGLEGKDIHWVAKHYGADERVMDVMRRAFGVGIEEVPPRGQALPYGVTADMAVEERAKSLISAELEREDDLRPLLVHMGGVHLWQWLDAMSLERAEVPVAGVSHTTSDGRDLVGEKGRLSIPVELMSMSEAKIADEIDRFTHSLMFLLGMVEKQLDQHVRARRFIIKGFGNIMGPAMAAALKSMRIDFAIQDPDPAAQKRALDAGYEVIQDLKDERHRRLVVLGCATGKAVRPDEIEALEHPAIFLQVQTGRDAFPMEWVEEKARGKGGVLGRQFITHVEGQPTVEYTLDLGDRKVKHTFVADGYVANLSSARPNNTEISVLTSLLIEESVRQAMWRMKRLESGDETQKGAHPLECIRIDLTPGKPRRLISLFARNLHDVIIKPLSRQTQESPDLAALLKANLDQPILVQVSADVGAKDEAPRPTRPKKKAEKVDRFDLPRPGIYSDDLGRVMVQDRSTSGAWEMAKPKTRTGKFAKAIVSHRFREGSAQWDGALDGKAMERLIELGIEDRLIEVNAKQQPVAIDAFLDELRPYQLDVVKEGADAIRKLIATASSRRTFFEITQSMVGRVWSDAGANRLLTERILAGRS